MENVKHLLFRTGAAAKSLVMDTPTSDSLTARLDAAHIPVTNDPCRLCPDPCEDYDDPNFVFKHDPWPTKFFDVDTVSDMLGRVKPYFRQVVISTGKSDWEREVTDVNGTLASYLTDVHSQLNTAKKSKDQSEIPGVFSSDAGGGNLMILNGSNHSTSSSAKSADVLVFPDFKIVSSVDNSLSGAEKLWKGALDPHLSKAGTAGSKDVRSWTLPYSSVILLCSHKKRDNRCAIAAPVLKTALTHSLESLGWEVHDQPDDPEGYTDPALEDIQSDDRDTQVTAQLQSHSASKRALILYCSHIGGHKYAGNVIIYTPQGAGIWYGRVSTHEVAAVTRTITEGKVYPALLRGGVNLKRPEGKTLIDW